MYNRYITQQKEKNVTGKQKLKATIGLPQAIALNIGAVLGSGILLMPGVSAQLSGPASLIAWGVMALFVLPMALSMGLLSSAYPNSAGVSHFATLTFGRKIGALVGWFFLMSVTIGGPIVAIIGAEYLGTMLGLGKVGVFWLSVLILLLGLGINFIGMKIAGQIQIAVMISILVVLITSIAGSVPHMDATNLTPFLPHGWISVGQTMALLFWCFIGWEAVSHLTEEFKNPEKDAIRSVWIAAILVGVLYFLTALATVATHSFSERETNASLVILVSKTFGTFGGWVIGFTAVFICIATLISYISAASRLAYALSRQQEAPKWMGRITEANGVPVGGLVFLTLFFILVMAIYGTGILSLTTFMQLPNATFILTYLAGCAAGIKLLKNHPLGKNMSLISFVLTAIVLPFVGWAILYPLAITILYYLIAHRKMYREKTAHGKRKDTLK